MNNVTIDTSQIIELFDSLNLETQKDIMMKGLRKGAKYLQSKAQATLVRKFPKASSTQGKAKKTMVEGVTVRSNNAMTEVSVSVMSHYFNVFYESGTEERQLKKTHKKDKDHHRTYKKGESRGKLKPLNFFKETREQQENNVISVITDEIGKEIQKLEK